MKHEKIKSILWKRNQESLIRLSIEPTKTLDTLKELIKSIHKSQSKSELTINNDY
jgi:hypothetical protein